MSRVAVLLLLLLVCSRSPSNADVVHAIDAARHPVAPATSDVIRRVANVRKAENRVAASGDGDDDKAVRRQLSEDDSDEYREHDDASKRKWGKYSLQAWGKRRWSAANGKAAWEKRDEEDELYGDERSRNLGQRAWNKRRWSANNGMRAWGKRSRRPYVDGRSKRSVRGPGGDEAPLLFDYQRPRWAPAKRQWRRTAARYDGPKRKWEFNSMNSWGKRGEVWPDDVDGRNWPKRSWSSDNSLRIWG